MKNIRLSFSPRVIILLILFVVDMLLILLTRDFLHLWSYFAFAGILPIIILSLGNAFLLRNNRLRDILIALAVFSFVEAIILTLLFGMVDLQQIIDNTAKSEGNYTISAYVDNSIIENFWTTWLPLVLVSVIATFFATRQNQNEKEI